MARPAADLLHDLQVHQFELELQNEELRRTQAALEDARNRYLDLYEFAPVGYLTIAKSGLVQEVNLAGATLLGAERRSLLGRRFAAFVAPEDLVRWQGVFDRAVEHDKGVSCDLLMRRGEGSAFHGRLDCSCRTGEGGSEVRIVLTDMTEHDRADEELRKAQHLDSLALLAGGVAHDFNNLLTALFGQIEAARETIPAGAPADQELLVALSALERARGLTRQLLAFAGGGGPHRMTLAVPKLLADAVALALGGSSVRAQVEVPVDLPSVCGDEGQIGQMLDNILLNARQAMPAGGEVQIATARRTLEAGQSPTLSGREYVEISIRDHGHGIPKEILPRVFDPFFTTKMAGRGLGLAVCHSIARRHGGNISVQSEEGVGTTFTVLLPAVTAGTAAPRPVPQTAASPQPKLRVLLMDDEPMVLKIGVRHLLAFGCSTDTAARGEEAVSLYQRALEAGTPYDVVILDLTIAGGMGGEQTVQKLQLIDPSVVAVACSGYFEGGIMADPANYGFRAALPKPYTKADLSAVLDLVTATRAESSPPRP